MNDAEYLFRQDIKEKKSMLSGARSLKRGARSKKCSLPSDSLTASQKRAMNGDVQVYRMNAPMTWNEFKKMPQEHQESYIVILKQKYGVNLPQLGAMFGVTNTTLNQYMKKHNFTLVDIHPHTKKMTSEQKVAWEKFLNSSTSETSEETTAENATSDVSAPAIPVTTKQPMQVSEISVNFSGDINFEDIVTYLQLVLGDKPSGTLSISFKKGET